MNRVPDRYVGLPNVGRPWRPRIDFLARLDYYGEPAPVNRLPPPPPVPAEAREVALTVPPPSAWQPETPPDCAGCGAPDGYPCCDDECSGAHDPDAFEVW